MGKRISIRPEQYQPRAWVKVMANQWCGKHARPSPVHGYYRDEETWKTRSNLCKCSSIPCRAVGNLIMNVGPTSRGTFDPRALSALNAYGDWLRVCGRSIYGCTQSDLTPPQDCRFTQMGSASTCTFSTAVQVDQSDGMAGKIEYAQLLHDGSQVMVKSACAITTMKT